MPVYLLHLDTPLSHAKHYLGFVESKANLRHRLNHHRAGSGARFTQVCNEHNIGYKIVRVWTTGDRNFERKLKRQKNSCRLCPVCNPQNFDHHAKEQ